MNKIGIAILSSCALFGTLTVAEAGTHYQRRYTEPVYEYGYDDTPVGFVVMRHTTRCEYPRGFNVTDFSRNVNGIPRGGADLIESGCGRIGPIIP